jgi:hypothetical protein
MRGNRRRKRACKMVAVAVASGKSKSCNLYLHTDLGVGDTRRMPRVHAFE